MKTFLAAVLFMAIAITPAYAQLPSAASLGISPEKQATMLMEQLGSKIEMSDAQVEKMTKVHKDFFGAADKIVNSGTVSQMNKLIKDNDNKVLKILGNEKFVTYKDVTKTSTGALLDKVKKE